MSLAPGVIEETRARLARRRSSAFHEAGHVVVEWLYGQRVLSAEVWRDGGGRTVTQDTPGRPLTDSDAIAAMAGLVAATLASRGDSMARLERGYGRSFLNGRELEADHASDYARVRRVTGGGDDDRYRDLMRRTITGLEQPDVWRRVDAVARALIERGHIDEREIADVLRHAR